MKLIVKLITKQTFVYTVKSYHFSLCGASSLTCTLGVKMKLADYGERIKCDSENKIWPEVLLFQFDFFGAKCPVSEISAVEVMHRFFLQKS